jgi:hypothetical protein
MAEQPKYGRCEIAEAAPLPELAFDLSGGQSLEGLGRTDMPVHDLPPIMFDLLGAPAPAVLELSVSLRPGSPAGEVALDLFRLYAAVNELALSHPGGGLRPVGAGELAEDGTVRVTFAPAEPEGARERLQKIAEAINTAAVGTQQYRAIDRCEARAA